MGNGSLKPGKSYNDLALEKYGCDLDGTIRCPDNEETLTCLNGGVCALYLKDLEDACEQRCRCTPNYIGKYCHIDAGFLNANVGLMVGILLAIIIMVFIIIFVWYCCKRRKRNSRPAAVETPGVPDTDLDTDHHARVPLSNRMEQKLKGSHPRDRARADEPGLLQAENGQAPPSYPIQNVARTPRTQKNCTSRSYSTYDNVSMETEDNPKDAHDAQTDGNNKVTTGCQVNCHLLACDNVDYGTHTAHEVGCLAERGCAQFMDTCPSSKSH